MQRFVLIVALAACSDGGRPTAPESTRAAPAPAAAPVGRAVPAPVAEKFPEAAALGTGERAIWIVTNETGALLAWGRGPAAAETETTNLVNLSLRRRQGTPPAANLTRGRDLALKTRSRHGESPAPQPDGRALTPPITWLGDAARMAFPDLQGVTLTRYPATRRRGALVTVVTVVIAPD